MNYRIKSVDPVEKTMIILWEDGQLLNHFIPDRILKRDFNTAAELDELIRNEAPEALNG